MTASGITNIDHFLYNCVAMTCNSQLFKNRQMKYIEPAISYLFKINYRNNTKGVKYIQS